MSASNVAQHLEVAGHPGLAPALDLQVWEGGISGRQVVAPRKAGMSNKDKGGRSSKTPAAKTAKEKRLEKQVKKTKKSFTGRDD